MTVRSGRSISVGVVLSLLLAACSSTPPPSPPPATPTPTVAPTPTISPQPSPTPSPQPSPTPPSAGIDLAGLRHDSRDLLYRTPGGAVPAGTPVTLRLRTFHGDASGVRLRTFSLNGGEERLTAMALAAQDVDCYEAALASASCDFWEAKLPNAEPDNVWYRFIVDDGPAQAFYADDTPALDGGLGAATIDPIDDSFALMVYVPGFEAPTWAAGSVIYQVFPDRFRNGDPANDPQTGDVRYDEPVLALPWATLPEGYCRHHADAPTSCPWRFEDNPPDWSPTIEGPRGRDYMGGDLRGVIDKLDYLAELGVDVIYFNPVFDGGSNHNYDTQDYTRIEPYFGTEDDFVELIAEARDRDMRVILDGVFNHMSSDSPFFDRYGHYDTIGACESVESPWRLWFYFRLGGAEGGPCAAPGGPGRMVYDSWFGFDSIPTINKTRADVVEYFLTGEDSITRRWLALGASGWRQDVSGDPSFPDGYWETFREVVRGIGGVEGTEMPLAISETWQKDGALLRALRGDRFDTTMNYRLRDAVLGLLTPHSFDAKGFPASGRPIAPSEFAARMLAQQEDYPPAAYFTLMNLLDTHDTERALWALTPGAATQAAREFDASNVAEGAQRLRIASLIQFTVPGMPSIYYGDEVGVTGADDPDDRRTYPWADLGGQPDGALYAHYQSLAHHRRDNPALGAGDFRILLADDTADTIAFGRRTNQQAAIVAVNRSAQPRSLQIPVGGFVPDDTTFVNVLRLDGPSGPAPVARGGVVQLDVSPLSAVLILTGEVDLEPLPAPTGLTVTDEGDGQVSLAWQPVAGRAGYNVYRSPVSGGGWVRANEHPLADPAFTDTVPDNGRRYHYVVTSLDIPGNESAYSNEVAALPHLAIDAALLAGPEAIEHVISTIDATPPIRGSVHNAATGAPGATPTLRAQLGYGPAGTAPATEPAWRWIDAPFAADVDGADEFAASLLPDLLGSFDYVYRFTTTDGRDWIYADLAGVFEGVPTRPGRLTVGPSIDTTAPATPTDLAVGSASIAGVELSWAPIAGDATLHGYEIGRAPDAAGPFETIALVAETQFVDLDIAGSAPLYYVVRALDESWNRSPDSAPVEARPGPRPVSVVFNVTIPPPTGRAVNAVVHIAGTLNRLDPALPEWDPAGAGLTKVDDTHWTITIDSTEGLQVDYKYVLGTWDLVEKGENCEEISNRRLTVAYGEGGMHVVQDDVLNWRNVADCPN